MTSYWMTQSTCCMSVIIIHAIIIIDYYFYSPASVIGKGGFGEVHKALYNGVTIAVKVFSAHSAEMQGTTPHQLIRQEVGIITIMCPILILYGASHNLF